MKKALTLSLAAILCLNFGALSLRVKGAGHAPPPDLEFVKITGTLANQVSFDVISHGYKVPAKSIDVLIMAYKASGETIWSHTAPIEQEIPADKTTAITIILPAGKSLAGNRFALIVDGTGKLGESNESNNASQVTNGPQNFPDTPGSLDLRFREALYFTPFQTGSKERFGTASQPLKVKRSEVSNCTSASDQCGVALKVFVMKSGEGKSVPVVKITNLTNGKTNSGSVIMETTQGAKEFIFSIVLNVGDNKLRIDVDTNGQYKESNEGNNSFEIPVSLWD